MSNRRWDKPLPGDIYERERDGEIILGIIIATCVFALIGAACVGWHGFHLVKGLLS